MPFGSNMYYSDPTVGRIAGNLATAIYGDPEARAKRGLYDAQVQNYGAEADKNTAEAEKAREEAAGYRTKNTANTGLAESLRTLFGKIAPNVDPAALAGVVQSGGGNADQLTQGIGNTLAQIFGVSPTVDDKATSLTLQGKPVDQNFAPTVARADEVAGRNSNLKTGEDAAKQLLENRGAMSREIYGQGQQNNRAANTEAGVNSRFYNSPIQVSPNSEVFFNPRDPRYSSMGANLFGPKTGTADRVPPEVSGANLDDVVLTAAQMMGGVKDQGGRPILNPDFEAVLTKDPAKLAQARIVAADTLQKTRNVAQAAKAFMQAMGLPQGSAFQNVSNGNPFTSDMQIVPPVGAAPQGPAAPSAPMGGPPAGYTKAPDGKFYRPDPARPGKFLMLQQ